MKRLLPSRWLVYAAILAGAGCEGTPCEEACEDWQDTCADHWSFEPIPCADNCEFDEKYGLASTECYACFAKHEDLCTDNGSETRPGEPCYYTCG